MNEGKHLYQSESIFRRGQIVMEEFAPLGAIRHNTKELLHPVKPHEKSCKLLKHYFR